MASSTRVFCPHCFRIRPKEAHHVFPQTNWGEQPNGPFLWLCGKCHKELDRLVLDPSLTRRQILDITAEWLCT